MLLFLASLALADPECPELTSLIVEATEAFDEARVAEARERLAEASDALACQEQVVTRSTLQELYQLDALASVADQDPKAALYAIIRSVTLDPTANPPEDVGPELIEQHRQWADRLSKDLLLVSTADPSVEFWIDGERVEQTPVQIVGGEHLIQARTAQGWTSRVVELVEGRPPLSLPLVVERYEPPAPPPGERSAQVAPPPPPPTPRRRRIGLAVGLGMAVAGAAFVGGGYVLERQFDDRRYDAPVYGDCTRAQSCWTTARADQIAADARQSNALYVTGYSLAGVGLTVSGIDLAVQRNSATLRVRGRF
ncbi:MAG: hypothetical protein EA397_08355 [Deltaproteobacteria bacterium]|nr:MAG: hypothetical protein EA397_08355 [Deltaproteobacteria bacterium]